jgi:signal transduction histidine kinase
MKRYGLSKYNLSPYFFRLLIVFVVLTIGIVIFGYLHYEEYRESLKKVNEDELSAIADLKVHEISKWRQELIADAKVISKTPFIASYVQKIINTPRGTKLKQEILTWMRYFKSAYNYKSVILLDAKGMKLLSADDGENISETSKSIALERMRKKEIELIDLNKDKNSGNIQLEIYIPILVNGGNSQHAVGVFLLTIDPHKFLYPLIQSWPTSSQTAETLLVRREGDEVVFLNELRHRKNTALSLRFPINRRDMPAAMLVTGKEGLKEGFDYRGKRVFAALRAISDSPWFLESKIDVEEVFAPVRERAWIIIIGMVVFIISAGLGMKLLWNKQAEVALRKAHDELEMRVQERTAEIKKANRALKMLYECNQIIVHAVAEIDFLRDICRTIVEVGGYRMAWVGFAERNGDKKVRPVAQAGYEKGYLESLNITWSDSERGRGPTGTAIRTGTTYIARNISTDPNFVPWRAEALKRGYASSIAIPLIAEDQTLGALMMYAIEPDAFDTQEVILLKGMADDIAYCISSIRVRAEHKRTDEELKKYREHLETMVEKRTEELKRTSDELKRSNEDLQQFAYVASHDLQEPLRGIAGLARLLEKRYKGKLDEKADEFIDYIIDDTKRMQMLINDLLEYSRVSGKGMVFKPTNCSVALEQAIYNLRSSLEESGAELTYDLLPTVMSDEALLSRLFQNLVGNAIKFSSREPLKIHVSARRKEAEWVFSIKDTGIGIDPRQTERIFVIFQRLHNRKEYSGTGIGLAICKKIVESHGGQIWVESEIGRGSTFYFTIPDRQETT